MTDFTTAGQPFETPIGAAFESYAQTPPTFSRAFGKFFDENSYIGRTARSIERSSYQPVDPRQEAELESYALAADPNYIPGQEPGGPRLAGLSNEPAIPTPLLSPEEYNKRFAPIGPDGKQVSIGDKPMTEGAARLIGKAKADEIERESVLARFSQAHSFPVTFGTGMAAFMLDPVNAASTFLPGIGEETALAGLGRVGLATTGIAARTAARAAAGATSAAIAQAPLSLARWGMGQEEASDYGLREAFKDVAFAAAGGAILHAGFGAAGDALRARRLLPAEAAETTPVEGARAIPEEAATVLNADAPTKMDAMRAAVAQVAEGREVDVMPVFDVNAMRLVSEAAQLRARHQELTEFLGGLEVPPEGPAAAETLARVSEVERQMNAEGLEAGARRELAQRRDELLTNTNPETLREQAAPVELRRQAEAQQASIAGRLQEIAAEQARVRAEASLSPFARIAETQREMYESGYAPGIASRDLSAADEAIYEPKPEEMAEAEAPPKKPGGEEQTETDKQLTEAEAAFKRQGEEGLHPEDKAELERAAENMKQADQHEQAVKQAAQCIMEAAE